MPPSLLYRGRMVKAVFQVAHCEICKEEYLVLADPNTKNHYYFSPNDNEFDYPLFVTIGGSLCLLGHDLVDDGPAAFSENGNLLFLQPDTLAWVEN